MKLPNFNGFSTEDRSQQVSHWAEAKFYRLRNWRTESGATRITTIWGGGREPQKSVAWWGGPPNSTHHLLSVSLTYELHKHGTDVM